MARANRAISLGISALIVIALILIVGFGLFVNDTFNTTSTTERNVGTTNTSSSGHPTTTNTTTVCLQPTGSPVGCATTSTSKSTTTTSTTVSNTGPYLLSFNQTIFCGPGSSLYGVYFIPWSVTLTSGSYEITKAQPPNSTGTSNYFTSTKNQSYSSISFSVPDGRYNYTINPTNDFENRQTGASSGTITINGNNATVYVRPNLASCGSTITTTTTFKTYSNTTTTTQTSSTSQTSSSTITTTTSVNETCTPMNTGNQTVTETITLCRSESTRSSNSSS